MIGHWAQWKFRTLACCRCQTFKLWFERAQHSVFFAFQIAFSFPRFPSSGGMWAVVGRNAESKQGAKKAICVQFYECWHLKPLESFTNLRSFSLFRRERNELCNGSQLELDMFRGLITKSICSLCVQPRSQGRRRIRYEKLKLFSMADCWSNYILSLNLRALHRPVESPGAFM